jgi:hypothetical protein
LPRLWADASHLRAELVSPITPFFEQSMAERADDVGMLAIDAALRLSLQERS